MTVLDSDRLSGGIDLCDRLQSASAYKVDLTVPVRSSTPKSFWSSSAERHSTFDASAANPLESFVRSIGAYSSELMRVMFPVQPFCYQRFHSDDSTHHAQALDSVKTTWTTTHNDDCLTLSVLGCGLDRLDGFGNLAVAALVLDR